MGWTTPPSFVLGHVETSAELNVVLHDNLTFLYTGQFVRAYLSSNQSLTSGTTTTIGFAAETEDLLGLHDNSTNNGRITITAANAGVWWFAAAVQFASNATGIRTVTLRKNGSTDMATASVAPLTGVPTAVRVEDRITLAATDYVEVRATQNSGGNLNAESGTTLTYVEATWVGSTT